MIRAERGVHRLPYIVLLLTGFLFAGKAPAQIGGADGGEGGATNDTAQAIVLYGNNFLFDPARFEDEGELTGYIDSLLELDHIDFRLVEEINLFMEVRRKNEHEIISLIDSLFDQANVPYALINQINYYVATRNLGRPGRKIGPGTITSYYAESRAKTGHCFFEAWDNHNPHPVYDPSHEPDSTVVLVVADSMSYCDYVHPFPGVVTSNFGWRNGRAHNGIDIDLQVGDPVRSAFDGIVRVASREGGYGNLVVVRHYNGLETYYAHLHRLKVKPGQVVEAGQIIGSGGNTGNSTGSHLHFEVRFRGKPINPKHLISFNDGLLHSEAVVINKTRWSYSAFPKDAAFHTVAKGEWLSLIASRYGLTISQLCELNGISRKTVLKVGQQLRVS